MTFTFTRIATVKLIVWFNFIEYAEFTRKVEHINEAEVNIMLIVDAACVLVGFLIEFAIQGSSWYDVIGFTSSTELF